MESNLSNKDNFIGNNNNSIIKIAIQLHPDLKDENKSNKLSWFLYNLPNGQKTSIESIIDYSREFWNLDPKKEYSLIMTIDETQHLFRFITDDHQNRSCFTQGAVIELYYSVRYVVSKLLEEFQQSLIDWSNEDRLTLLKKICIYASDQVFVAEFDEQKGVKLFITSFISNKFKDIELHYVLDIIAKILDHDIIQWYGPNAVIEKNFIEYIIEIILTNKYMLLLQSNQHHQQQTPHQQLIESSIPDVKRQILILSLNILESAILNAAKLFLSIICEKLSIKNLSLLLEHEKYPEIQQNVLSLINVIIQNIDPSKRREQFRMFKETILRYVTDTGSEITHQLYVLQTLLLRSYDEQLNQGATAEQANEKWREICRNYDSEMDNLIKNQFNSTSSSNQSLKSSSLNRSNSTVSNKSNTSNTLLMFNETIDKFGIWPSNSNDQKTTPSEIFANPPGLWILNLLCYYSGKHNESFVRFIMSNQSSSGETRPYDCPLIIASFRILSLIVEILGIGKPPRDEGHEYYPMLMKHEEPVEEFFSIGLTLFNRTWHEIHATFNDLDIACDFLAEKFHKILSNPTATVSFENFQKELSKISYTEISHRWREERLKREQRKEEMPAIKELKRLLLPEMKSIVKQNRLNYLVRGTRFDKYTAKGQRLKDKFWYCRLSQNHKTLLYGDVDEDCKNLDEKLCSKFDIADAGRLVVGKECPHMRDSKGKKTTLSLAFALIPRDDDSLNGQQPSPLCFVAGKPEIFDYWIDGLNSLLKLEMTSNESKKDVEMLLDLDVKLRLLDIEGLNIPDQPPELPPSPPEYDFEYRPQHHTSLASI